jgi:hypothetical protein
MLSVLQLRNVAMDNLNAFIGLTFNEGTRFLVIWQHNVRCTLEDVVFNDDFNLTAEFQSSFVNDILKVDEFEVFIIKKMIMYTGSGILTREHYWTTRCIEHSHMSCNTVLVDKIK